MTSSVAIGKPERHVLEDLQCGSMQQQSSHATITVLLLVRSTYMGVVLRSHPVRGEPHIQRNANREVATTSPLFYKEPHRSHALFSKAVPGKTFTIPGKTCTILLRSETPSGMCAKLCTVAASNNKVHPTRSLYYCLFAPHIYRCCSSRTSRSWWIAHST